MGFASDTKASLIADAAREAAISAANVSRILRYGDPNEFIEKNLRNVVKSLARLHISLETYYDKVKN